ncbi:tautomerase family protein [Flavobacterium agrisoli]|uniref:Tautomerase family protein n=1 Tax=Flavobacterium agrisoli TaxID=2793066 RepID=A0A934UJE4_9FLAO|nr:tautomerase family protein [Flavobacterium agrisoli]MBK0369871.1 tautomerase family protein [Flavobacterium agrisoli]
MGQIKIFGIHKVLHPIREKLSEILSECMFESFQFPKEKKAHRFIYIEEDSFFYFEGRTTKHTLIEISLFEGRSIESKKKLYQLLFEKLENQLKITPMDLEITLFETPLYNWGIRGKSADELSLNYNINV